MYTRNLHTHIYIYIYIYIYTMRTRHLLFWPLVQVTWQHLRDIGEPRGREKGEPFPPRGPLEDRQHL